MNYLTTSELAKKWNISSRMIAYYCEAGRISGVVKKGKAWLIPEYAQKPIGKVNATNNIIDIDENIAEKGISSIYSKAEVDNRDNINYAREFYAHLGLTRETLRYYEKIGLIEPKRHIENFYRKFDSYDISNILGIDFLRKRGFTPVEIKNLRKQSNPSDTSIALKKKLVALDQSIYNQQCMRKRLQETQEFYEYALASDGKFEIRDFPLYSVLNSSDDLCLSNKIIRKLDEEDIMSHTARTISFDSTGIKGSKICIVKKITAESKDYEGEFLESGRCIYAAVMLLREEDRRSLIEKIFIEVHTWAKEQGVELKGIMYGFDRFIVSGKNIEEKKNQYFSEIWIPIK